MSSKPPLLPTLTKELEPQRAQGNTEENGWWCSLIRKRAKRAVIAAQRTRRRPPHHAKTGRAGQPGFARLAQIPSTSLCRNSSQKSQPRRSRRSTEETPIEYLIFHCIWWVEGPWILGTGSSLRKRGLLRMTSKLHHYRKTTQLGSRGPSSGGNSPSSAPNSSSNW